MDGFRMSRIDTSAPWMDGCAQFRFYSSELGRSLTDPTQVVALTIPFLPAVGERVVVLGRSVVSRGQLVWSMREKPDGGFRV